MVKCLNIKNTIIHFQFEIAGYKAEYLYILYSIVFIPGWVIRMREIVSYSDAINQESIIYPSNCQRGPQRPRYTFKITCTLQFSPYQHIAFGISQKYCFKHSPVMLRICCKKAPPSDIGIKAWLKGPMWASQARVLFSASDCLCCWQPNGTSLKDNVYMSSRTVCLKESNWSAMATKNIFMQLLQVLLVGNVNMT